MRRLSSAIAILGLLAGLAGAVMAARVLRAHGGIGAPAFWMIVPIASGCLSALATLTGSVAFVWTTTGVVCAFVVFAAFSLGPFFGLEALLLVAAALVHAATLTPRWKLATAPVWFLMGVGTLGSMFLVRDVFFNLTHGCVSGPGYSQCESVSYAEATIGAAWLLLASALVRAGVYTVARVVRAR